ncbi:uroporphyrinogen-III C-methyltransferase [Clostridium vincentii]|uniref:uroporphyrinogen-III C-methyltransferase n=1 Tax=Clostridium vincentii TaxID=52704 RepID=A0A2T0BEE7_9CLOT|nr:uroporphyrinogen-III C-methyltransferase [Clostridium vincentii]PRR82213.1 Uroporphyrinogen-III C-methyltransferase [Clostridium vincentii]
MAGMVYLVGAGTGAEDLITQKALRLIKEADVIVYDRLINENLLSYCKSSCELINVGKAASKHMLPQDKINQLLFDKALEKEVVVRLKGGDPFIFGRGSEEGIFLKKRQVYFEVVPGISSLSGVTSYSGIPITHRGVSNEIHVFTGHEKGESDRLSIDFNVVSKLKGTLVFYMGLSNIKRISEGLINGGMDEKTPIALISTGTYGDQKTVTDTLKNIQNSLEGIKSPALIVVGQVVNLRESLNWFESKPMFGRKILITRHKDKNFVLKDKLEQQGARVHCIDTIDFKPIEDKTKLFKVFDNISNYDYLVFNSAKGVEYFTQEFMLYKKDIRGLGKLKIISMGEITKNKIEKYYLNAELVYDGSSSLGFIDLLKNTVKKEEKILIIVSDISEKTKYKDLEKYCNKVDVVDAYSTAMLEISPRELHKVCDADIITFHSPSAIKSFFKFLEESSVDIDLTKKIFVTVGTTTKLELTNRNIKNIKVANPHNDEGMLNTILALL